jgi:hypothetical protein
MSSGTIPQNLIPVECNTELLLKLPQSQVAHLIGGSGSVKLEHEHRQELLNQIDRIKLSLKCKHYFFTDVIR